MSSLVAFQEKSSQVEKTEVDALGAVGRPPLYMRADWVFRQGAPLDGKLECFSCTCSEVAAEGEAVQDMGLEALPWQ